MRPHSLQTQEAADALDPLPAYLQQVRTVPLLTAEQEQALARRIVAGQTAVTRLQHEPPADPAARKMLQAQIDDAEGARQQFIQANLRLVIHIAKQYRSQHLTEQGLSLLDLIQEGNIGLIHAVETFDATRGARFSTYAAWWIRQAIRQAVEDKARLIRLPTHITDKRRAAQRATAQLWYTLQREPTQEEIAAASGYSVHQLQLALSAPPDSISLSTPLDRESGDDRTLEATVADPQAVAPEDAAERQVLRAALAQALGGLGPRERQVVVLRYGLDGSEGCTYEEIGALLGVSRERSRQIEDRALAKLRPAVRALGLGAFLALPTPQIRPGDHIPQRTERQAEAVRIRRLTPSATVPTLPPTLPPGLPRGFAAVFAALASAPSIKVASGRSGYSYSSFCHILSCAWRALDLPEQERRQGSPLQLAQRLSAALRKAGRRKARPYAA